MNINCFEFLPDLFSFIVTHIDLILTSIDRNKAKTHRTTESNTLQGYTISAIDSERAY